jgi:oligopeptidase A
MSMNPLLDFSGLPRYTDIRPEHIAPALDRLLAEGRAAVEHAVGAATPATWDDFVTPLEDANERVGRAWGQVAHLHSVLDSPELREAYNANLPKATQYWAELGQHEGLFHKFQTLHDTEYATLGAARRAVVDHQLRDFRLGGAELPEDKKARFMEIQESQARIAAKFEENLLDATNDYGWFTEDAADLAGLPEDDLAAAREAAEQDGKPGYKLTLHMPSYLPAMQYASRRELRETLYRAYATRASELGENAAWDNSALIDELLELRAEEAQLLGYACFAEVSLEPKMAESPEQVMDFLRDLGHRARPYAERDLAELRDFAARELGLATLEAWDMAYASEKLREARYAFSEQEVKQYFPEARAVAGLFRVIETLYGVSIRETAAPLWHEDAKFYEIAQLGGGDGVMNQVVGHFYTDLYARAGKRGGAWMDDAITRRALDAGIQTPVAYLTCNFSRPVAGKPALFTHDEVITLFHEAGHGLHHLLTRQEDLPVSGINGVEWDAVELPSQFMENFCWEWDVLKHMTAHVDTHEPLPRALFDKMLAAKNFQAGLQTLRQIEFSLFDMRLHGDFEPHGGKSVLELLNEVRREVAVLIPPAFNRFPNSFSHIFAGGYAAGYYSYKWAEVLSADAFAAFEEGGVLNPEVGARFRDEVLSVGGARPALESFKAFRGREPNIDALLRHNGMM